MEKDKTDLDKRTAFNYQISGFDSHGQAHGIYQVLGIYEKDQTASDLFPSLAQQYLLDYLELRSNQIKEKIRNLMEQRLKEF